MSPGAYDPLGKTQCPQGQRWHQAWQRCMPESIFERYEPYYERRDKGLLDPWGKQALSPLADGLGGGQATQGTQARGIQTQGEQRAWGQGQQIQTPFGGKYGGGVDLPQDPELGPEGGTCPEGERWIPSVGCVPLQSGGIEEGEGLVPQILNWIEQGITDTRTFFECDWQNHWIWNPQENKCTPASEYGGPATDTGVDSSDPSTWDEQTKMFHQECVAAGYAGFDPATGQCTNKPPPTGQRWDEVTQSYVDICPEGSYWDAITATCKQGENPYGQDIQSNYDPYGNIIDPNRPVVADQPKDLFAGGDYDLATMLGLAPGEEGAEQRYWDAKMARYNEEYEKSKEAVEESLNVKGLYYSGTRGKDLRELEEQKLRDVEYMTSEFQHEAFQRELQRTKLGVEYALGAEALNIQYAIAQGKLELDQLIAAMEENLGLGALDIQQQGLDLKVIQNLAEISMAEAQTELQRQNIWLNVVTMLNQMGLSEEEISNMWAKIAGQSQTPAF